MLFFSLDFCIYVNRWLCCLMVRWLESDGWDIRILYCFSALRSISDFQTKGIYVKEICNDFGFVLFYIIMNQRGGGVRWFGRRESERELAFLLCVVLCLIWSPCLWPRNRHTYTYTQFISLENTWLDAAGSTYLVSATAETHATQRIHIYRSRIVSYIFLSNRFRTNVFRCVFCMWLRWWVWVSVWCCCLIVLVAFIRYNIILMWLNNWIGLCVLKNYIHLRRSNCFWYATK